MVDFEITLPDQKIDEAELEKKNRAMFFDDLQKGGLLARTLVFTKMNQPVSTTEITKILTDYFKIDYDRATVYRALQKLSEKHIIATTTTGVVSHISDAEKSETHKQIMKKYYEFLQRIPEQFRKKFRDINYFWVSNGIGTKYIEWCCKLLKFKCKVKNE